LPKQQGSMCKDTPLYVKHSKIFIDLKNPNRDRQRETPPSAE